jgi:integrase
MPNLKKDPHVPPEPNLFIHPGSSMYYARAYVVEIGKERVKCLETTDRLTAIARKNQLIAQWKGARRDSRGRVLFDSVALELLELMTSKAEKTFLDYEGHLRLHLLPYFTGKMLDEVAPLWPRYRAHQKALDRTRKLKHDRKALRRVFSHAMERGLIDAVPRFRLDPEDLRVTKQKEYTDEEYRALYAEAKPKEKLKLETYIKTGLRSGTVRKLEWSWFNWETGEVTIPGPAMKMGEDHVVVLDRELLAKYRERFERARPRFVFPHRDDPQRPEAPSDKEFQRIKAKLGITKKRHWFRGSAACRAVRAGVPESIARSTLAMSPQVFARHYHAASIEDRRRFTEAIADGLPGSNASDPDQGGQKNAE